MGALAKITKAQIWIIAAVLSAIAAGAIYYFLVMPEQARLEAAESKFSTNQAIAVTKPQEDADQIKAKGEVRVAQAKWARYDRELMPNIDISNLIRGQQQLWNEQINVLGPITQRYLYADKTVQVVKASLALPAPPTDPNAIAKKYFEFPLGDVTVQGKFNQILNHAERWNRFNRLVLVDGLTLAGNSPSLTGSYKLTAYIFTHDEKGAGASIPQATATQGGGGGGFGGPPPGLGGPPAGFTPPGAPPGYSGGDTGAPPGAPGDP